MPGTLRPKKAEDSEGPSFFGKLFTSIIALLSSVIEGGYIKTQSTPTPPAPEKLRVGDNFRRREFQAKEYVFLFTQAERARVLAMLLEGEALDIAIDEGILQGDITEGTIRRLRACFTTDPHRLEVRRQFHGRIHHPGEKLTAFIRELRRLCAEGFTDDTPEVREQRILQQALEGTRDPSTRRAFLTAAPTSIQEALDRAGTIEQVNGVLERDQQYRTREIAPAQYRSLARPQPFNHQERYGPQRMQRPPYQKPHCYYCSLYGKRAYRCGHNRGESVTRPVSKLICPSLVLNKCHIRSPTVSGLLWSAPSVLLLDTGAACCLINKHRVPRQVLPQQDSGVRLVAANGTDIRSVGWLNVPITLGEKVREHPMLVVDNLPWDAILGIDFLTTLQGKLLLIDVVFRERQLCNHSRIAEFMLISVAQINTGILRVATAN
ncbi:hypothetical protein EG68_07856 [Paragonimus skrjabini miyazakii]|uniref:Peptidase A2 domain-containing protein n=1 Tax=Paragonimus skrjabini miyazakii TaxID=59628 RepID=A0A8S9YP06_9TREM|nr:hypothetical protein EG68_07856 [Paragonimus skrjabini miyazakii]